MPFGASSARERDATPTDADATPTPVGQNVEGLLAAALERASAAGRWDVVAALARELEARRLEAASNVVMLDSAKRRSR